jgi:hypothetical protein
MKKKKRERKRFGWLKERRMNTICRKLKIEREQVSKKAEKT